MQKLQITQPIYDIEWDVETKARYSVIKIIWIRATKIL